MELIKDDAARGQFFEPSIDLLIVLLSDPDTENCDLQWNREIRDWMVELRVVASAIRLFQKDDVIHRERVAGIRDSTDIYSCAQRRT